jgi:Flp pilus assembly pilin Flp
MLLRKDNQQKPAGSYRKAQSTLEYALIIGVVIAAVLTMFHFFGRSIQGKLKESVDAIGGQFVANAKGGGVFTPGQTHSANSSEAMRKTSSGFLFHTGMLPLGLSMSVSTGSSTTTSVASVTQNAQITSHDPEPSIDRDGVVNRMKDIADDEYDKYPTSDTGGRISD